MNYIPKKDYSNNLVANYKFNETSGSTCIDSKGNYNGTYHSTNSITDINGTYRNFNNTIGNNTATNYISFLDSIFSIGKKSIKFKIKVSSSAIMHILNTTNATGQVGEYGIAIFSNSYRLGVNIVNNGDKQGLYSNSILDDNEFHTFLYTYDGNITHKLYIDDMINPEVIYNSDFIETHKPNYNLFIGTRDTLTYGFKGNLDELEIYNEVIEYTNKKYLIQDGDRIKTTNDGVNLMDLGTSYDENTFNIYGMNDLTNINFTIINKIINNEYKILMYKI